MNEAFTASENREQIKMNEVKTERIIKSFYDLHKYAHKQNVNLRKLVQNQQKQIDELTKQVNHLRINLIVRPDKIIKIPKVIK